MSNSDFYSGWFGLRMLFAPASFGSIFGSLFAPGTAFSGQTAFATDLSQVFFDFLLRPLLILLNLFLSAFQLTAEVLLCPEVLLSLVSHKIRQVQSLQTQ